MRLFFVSPRSAKGAAPMCKFGRKFTSALLALALFVSLLPIGAAPAQAEGLTIEIDSEYDLWNFAYALSQNTPGYANANVSLEGDIDVAISSWVPIGTDIRPGMPAIDFTGTFDGNGHTINNINIIDEDKTPHPGDGDNQFSSDVGLFARLGSGGTVKNLKVTGSVSGGEMGINVGGIVGANNGGTVTNCTFSGSVNGGSATNVGGIVGLNSGTVTDCTNSGGVSGKGNVGGVVGDNSGSSYVGGAVGENDDGSVTNCYYLSANAENDGARTAEQFHSGEVAHLLGEAWGQDLSTDDSWPTLIALDESAQPVYQVTVVYGDYDNAPTTETSYTNNPTAPSETPSRDGYTFDSWKTTGEGTTTITYTAQ